ncbi:MAG: hypothetical protein VW475_05480 [Curvibacter sp.]
MRRRFDHHRLGLALLLSLLLHALLLVPRQVQVQPGTTATHPGPGTESLRAGLSLLPPPPPAPQATRPIAPAPVSSSPQADARGHYPAEQLTRPPRPLGEVNLNLPEAGLLTAPGRLRLTLWIDAEGRVLSYHLDAPDLPEEYSMAVAEVFATLPYTPGELLGRKVGSILKLEIEHRP